MSGFADAEDVEQVLLGSEVVRISPGEPSAGEFGRRRDGLWMQGHRPRATRVSAVLTGHTLLPWTCARTWPRLWTNPWATHPVETDLPLPRGLARPDGTFAYADAEGTPHALLGLPSPAWPGPGAPYPRAD